eukprot:906723_1
MSVFAVSSKEYRHLTGQSKRKALGSSPAVFSSVDETEIPAVQAHILSLGAEKMHRDLTVRYERLRAGLKGLVNSLKHNGQGSVDSKTIKSAFLKQMNEMDEELKSTIANLQRDIVGIFDKDLFPVMQQAVTASDSRCVPIVEKYGKSPFRWNTYRSIMNYQGIFTSSTRGAIDINADVSGPYSGTVSNVWEGVFGTRIPSLCSRAQGRAIAVVQRHCDQFQTYLSTVGVDVSRMRPVNASAICVSLKQLSTVVAGVVDERQKDLSRQITPKVQSFLAPAYEVASQERGSGVFARMKKIMENRVRELLSEHVFQKHVQSTRQVLTVSMMEGIQRHVAMVTQKVRQEVSIQFQGYWARALPNQCAEGQNSSNKLCTSADALIDSVTSGLLNLEESY